MAGISEVLKEGQESEDNMRIFMSLICSDSRVL